MSKDVELFTAGRMSCRTETRFGRCVKVFLVLEQPRGTGPRDRALTRVNES